MLRLLLNSLLWHRRTHLLVLLAVAVSTAVIGGSLIVGDSVRGSLRKMTLSRLGGISHAIHAPVFFREKLAQELAARKNAPAVTAPALLLNGSVERRDQAGTMHRATAVTLLGLHAADWSLLNTADITAPPADGVVLGWRTAQELKAAVGDSISIWVELPSSIPRDSLMGERENLTVEIVLPVTGILPETAGASRFSLRPSQQLPHNAFLSLQTFQQRISLQELQATRRNPVARPGRINTLLIGGPAAEFKTTAADVQDLIRQDLDQTQQLQQAVAETIDLADVGLQIRSLEDRGCLSVESDTMILSDSLSAAVLTAARNTGVTAAPVQVYLVNELSAAARTDPKQRYSMYSIVAGIDFAQPAPLGPFLLNDGSPVPQLADSEIVLSAWLAEDLQVAVGDSVDARWHEVGSQGELPETRRTFTVRGILKPDDPVSLDRSLTPFVEGVTNAESFSDWKQPFPMEMERITPRDDSWWENYRAAPKAFVSLAAAEQLWKSRFGRHTSIRVASDVALPADRLQILSDRLRSEIRPLLLPAALGLAIRPIRAEGLQAAVGANNFTWLFIGFSFFLILSAILLAALMFQLGVRLRVSQIGLLEAVGFTPARARRLLTAEGGLVALAGTVTGTILAVQFAKLMIHGLTTWWVGAIGTTFLQLELRPQSLLIAAVVSFGLSVFVIWNAVRRTTRREPRELLQGLASDQQPGPTGPIAGLLGQLLYFGSIAAAVGLPATIMAGLLPASEAFGGMSWTIVCFFLAGFAWLTAGLLSLKRLLQKRAGAAVTGSPVASLTSLSLANAARNPQRSLLTAALIAFAAFVIVAVGAGRRNPVSETPELRTGNGGFRLAAESSQPILFDLNAPAGRLRLGLDTSDATRLPDGTQIYSFPLRPGDDASCLNLFQTTMPGILGASPEFIARGGFRFADTPGQQPWTKLNTQLEPRTVPSAQQPLPVIPVIGDLNTLQFSLKKKIGDLILFPDAQAPTHALEVVGMLDSSIFQGVLVMAADRLKQIAPEISGARYFLVETPDAASGEAAAGALETALQPFGVDCELVSRRLAGFLAVQNTYLATFQLLGGLGLLVGTLGLTAVMLRNVVERRREIALLRALGFRTSRIIWLIAAENSALLFWGLLTGTVSALIAMLPHLKSTGADVPWQELAVTLVAVAAVGTLAAVAPVRAAVKVQVREVLAGE